MNKSQLIQSIAHRILNRLKNYKKFSKEMSNTINYIKEIELQNQEILLGIYENSLDSQDENMVITTLGIYVFVMNTWKFVAYNQIDDIESPPKDRDLQELRVYLKTGEELVLVVKGGKGRTHNLWEFLRFLMRASEIAKR